jgi:hypothetical protein
MRSPRGERLWLRALLHSFRFPSDNGSGRKRLLDSLRIS